MSSCYQKKPKMILTRSSTIPSHRPNSPSTPRQRSLRTNGIKTPDASSPNCISPRSPRSTSDVQQQQQTKARLSYLARFEAQNQTKLQRRVIKPVIRPKSVIVTSSPVASSKKIPSPNNNSKGNNKAQEATKNKGQGEKVADKKNGPKFTKSCIPKPSSSTLIKSIPSKKSTVVMVAGTEKVEQKNSQKSISPPISVNEKVPSAEVRSSSSSKISTPQIQVTTAPPPAVSEVENKVQEDPNSEFDPQSPRREGECLFDVKSNPILEENVNEVATPLVSQPLVMNSDPSLCIMDDDPPVVLKETEAVTPLQLTSSSRMTTPSKMETSILLKNVKEKLTDEKDRRTVGATSLSTAANGAVINLTPIQSRKKLINSKKSEDVVASIEDQMNNNYIYCTPSNHQIDTVVKDKSSTSCLSVKNESSNKKLSYTIVPGKVSEMSQNDHDKIIDTTSPSKDSVVVVVKDHSGADTSKITSDKLQIIHENVKVNIIPQREFSEAKDDQPKQISEVNLKKKTKKGRRDVDEIEEIKKQRQTEKVTITSPSKNGPVGQQQKRRRSSQRSVSIDKKKKKRSRGTKAVTAAADPPPSSKTNSEMMVKKLKPKIKKMVKLSNDDKKCHGCGDLSQREWVPLSRKTTTTTRSRVKETVPENQEKNVKDFVSFSKMPLLYETGRKLQGVLRISNISATPLCFRVSACSPVEEEEEDRYKIEPKEGQLAPTEHTVIRLMTDKVLKETQVKSDIFKVETLLTTQTGKTSSTLHRRLWMNTPQSKITTTYTKSTLLYDPNDPFFQACLESRHRRHRPLSLKGDDDGDDEAKDLGSIINVQDIFQEIQIAQKNIAYMRRLNLFHNGWLLSLYIVGFAMVLWTSQYYLM